MAVVDMGVVWNRFFQGHWRKPRDHGKSVTYSSLIVSGLFTTEIV